MGSAPKTEVRRQVVEDFAAVQSRQVAAAGNGTIFRRNRARNVLTPPQGIVYPACVLSQTQVATSAPFPLEGCGPLYGSQSSPILEKGPTPILVGIHRGSKASKIRAREKHDKTLLAYYANPNHCEHCGAIIEVGVGQFVIDVRKKRFCDQSCSSTSLHAKRRAVAPRPVNRTCECGEAKSVRAGKCLKCKSAERTIDSCPKGEFFARRKNWISAATNIRRSARTAYMNSGKKQACAACDYALHFDVSHIKSVSSFSDDATIGEINAISNLVALCPNHHWEFDNGILDLSRGTISQVDGMTHYHSAAGSSPAPASNTIDAFGIPANAMTGKVTFGETRPDQFSRQA